MLKTIPELVSLASANVKKMSAIQAKLAIAEQDGLLIDVREPDEYAIKHAKSAINIPRGILEMKLIELEKNPSRDIYLHCATGGRASLAAEQLQRLGYINVIAINCKADAVVEAFR